MTLRWEAFLERVRERGEHDTPQDAERVARVVPAPCSAPTWFGDVRAKPAARLPLTATAAA